MLLSLPYLARRFNIRYEPILNHENWSNIEIPSGRNSWQNNGFK